MQVSKERTNFYVAQIRKIMVQNPDISIRGICEKLEESNLKLDKNYVGKLKKKVDNSLSKVNNLNTVRYSLEEIQEINLKIKRLWEIINSPIVAFASDKLTAMRILREERVRLEEIILHLGDAKKDLGTLTLEHTLSPELKLAIKSLQMQFAQKPKPVVYEEAITSEQTKEIKQDDKPANPNIQQLPGGATIDSKGPAISERW